MYFIQNTKRLLRLQNLTKCVSNIAHKSTGHRVVVSKISADPLEAVDKLALEPMDMPDLDKLPDDAVIVGVASVAVHWVDLLMMAGQYQHAPPLPYTPGMEYSGEVLGIGKNVDTVKPGDKVYVDGFRSGPRSYDKSYQSWGGMGTYSVAPQAAMLKLPEQFTNHQAASYLGAYETAHHALVKCADVKAGETVLIHGATGTTGLAAVQVASALGANVIATGGSDEKLAVVATQAFGAGKVIATHNYNSANKLKDSIQAVVKGVEVVYDTVGGAKLGQDSLRSLKFGGRYCIVGWTATPFAGGGRAAGANQQSANVLPTNLIMMKGAKVIGCPVAIHTNIDPKIRPVRLGSLDKMVQDGLISPHVSHVFPLEEVREALKAKWGRQVIGGCVLDCLGTKE